MQKHGNGSTAGQNITSVYFRTTYLCTPCHCTSLEGCEPESLQTHPLTNLCAHMCATLTHDHCICHFLSYVAPSHRMTTKLQKYQILPMCRKTKPSTRRSVHWKPSCTHQLSQQRFLDSASPPHATHWQPPSSACLHLLPDSPSLPSFLLLLLRSLL